MQWSQAQPPPVASASQDAEIRYQIRRLSNHASIAVYDGCNECGGHGIYATFVMTTVAEEDPSRPPWPASPSPGWTSGVDRLTGLPNGSPLGLQPRAAPPSSEAPPPPPLPASCDGSSCTSQADVDYCNACVDAPHPVVDSAQACCDACTAAGPTACWCSVFYEGTCWFKPEPNATAPIFAPGRVALWPPGNGPIPPLPPPGPEPSGITETHGPYLHGSQWPAVNSINDGVPVTLPPVLFPSYVIGPSMPGTYASEYGCVAMSSFESMSATLTPAHWSIHGGSPPDTCSESSYAFQACDGGNAMAQRNYPMDSIIAAYFGLDMARLDEVGEAAFARQLWMSMAAQALVLTTEVTTRRSHNTWGSLIWQLNEIWPTGGWGVIEYGGLGFTAGQVGGGRWKVAQHVLARHAYRDVITSVASTGGATPRTTTRSAPRGTRAC